MCGRVIIALVLFLILFVSCDRNGSTGSEDNVPPGQIENLMVAALADSMAVLSWTAPGDNDRQGTAASYVILYAPDSTQVALDSNCVVFDNPPEPKLAGTVQEAEIAGLSPDTTYWFGILSTDKAGNRSALSNIATRKKIEPIQLRIESPWNLKRVADLVTIRVSESGVITPDKIWFYGGDLVIDSATGPPWQINWDISNLPHGSSHTIHAVAAGPGGEIYSSDTVMVTIDSSLSPPTKPVFLNVSEVTDAGALVAWSPSPDDDFQRYWVRWQADNEPPDSQAYAIIYQRSDTTFFISNLRGLSNYTVTLTVEDLFGHTSSISAEIVTFDSIPPPVAITRVRRTSTFAGLFEWEPSSVHDFARYELVRSADSVSSGDDTIAAVVINQGTLTGYDKQYDFSIDNYYYVRVVDTQGNWSLGPVVLFPACLTANWAVELDGVDDLLVIPYVREVLRPNEWTIEMWVWAERRIPSSAVFSQSESDVELLMGDSFLRWGLTGCVMYQIWLWFPEKEWVHVAMTRSREKDVEMLYINGERIGHHGCIEPRVFTNDLFIGCRPDLSMPFKGLIDEVRIWKRSLTTVEIEQGFRKEITGSPKDLVGYWSFNEGGGGMSYSGWGPPVRLGLTGQEDSSDPLWILSTVPFDED